MPLAIAFWPVVAVLLMTSGAAQAQTEHRRGFVLAVTPADGAVVVRRGAFGS
jgi:hypothetical protein